MLFQGATLDCCLIKKSVPGPGTQPGNMAWISDVSHTAGVITGTREISVILGSARSGADCAGGRFTGD